jgi:uncharacterized FAD-dependent dehydrogenase
MDYDVAIVGCGPTGYMCAYKLMEERPGLRVVLIDKGKDIDQRQCPIMTHKISACPTNGKLKGCLPACNITSGFGGAGRCDSGNHRPLYRRSPAD